MPPGNTHRQQPIKVIERCTAEACIAIANRVAQERRLADDLNGSSAANLVAQFIREELLDLQATDSNKNYHEVDPHFRASALPLGA